MKTNQPAVMVWSSSVRLVHWLDALVVLGLLGTVFLRKTFLSYKTNGPLIQEKLGELNAQITLDAASGIAKAIRAPMWSWHYYLGFALVALLLYRVFLLLVQRENEILTTSLLGRNSTVKFKKRIARTLHVLYYLFVLVMVVTGLMLYFKEIIGLPGNVAKGIKEYHELLTLFFIAFVPLHIVAVIIAENTNEPGIVSAMIHGKRPRDPDSVKTD